VRSETKWSPKRGYTLVGTSAWTGRATEWAEVAGRRPRKTGEVELSGSPAEA
jgi:hypothetical protein